MNIREKQERAADNIRVLAASMVEKAKSNRAATTSNNTECLSFIIQKNLLSKMSHAAHLSPSDEAGEGGRAEGATSAL